MKTTCYKDKTPLNCDETWFRPSEGQKPSIGHNEWRETPFTENYNKVLASQRVFDFLNE